MYASCDRGHIEIVKLLLQNNANVSKCNRDGQSPLHAVCTDRYCDTYLCYLAHSEPQNYMDQYNRHLAYLEIVKLLIAWNADVTKCDKRGQTPLDVARVAVCSETVALLEEHLQMKSV